MGGVHQEKSLYLDPYFPTVDSKKPGLLTEEEEAVVNDLVYQFTTLPKLQEDINGFSNLVKLIGW